MRDWLWVVLDAREGHDGREGADAPAQRLLRERLVVDDLQHMQSAAASISGARCTAERGAHCDLGTRVALLRLLIPAARAPGARARADCSRL